MGPWIAHVGIRELCQPRNAEAPAEQGRGAQRRSQATGFEEERVEGGYAEERCHEFTWFAVFPSFFVHVVIEDLSTLVKASDSQRQEWRLADEEIISQVR